MRKISVGLSMIGSLMGMIAAGPRGSNIVPGRIYGPRVTATKDVGRSYGVHKRSRVWPTISAEDAATKRECIRRRRQMQRTAG
jgi:hypothetical protein